MFCAVRRKQNQGRPGEEKFMTANRFNRDEYEKDCSSN
jgi:hypothetical protein